MVILIASTIGMKVSFEPILLPIIYIPILPIPPILLISVHHIATWLMIHSSFTISITIYSMSVANLVYNCLS